MLGGVHCSCLHKLKTLDSSAVEILKAGAFSTRRTQLPYSRSPIDLTLEQTINKDVTSSAKGITSFTTSENAFRRWCINLTQGSMAVCELKDMTGLQSGETINKQLRQGRIEKDNKDIAALNAMIKSTCSPFDTDAPTTLVNIATGKAAHEETSEYLVGTLQRGALMRHEFQKECSEDDCRFLKRLQWVKVSNFAFENIKSKSFKNKADLSAAEGVRDAFGHILAKAAMTDDFIDLQHILSYPVTKIPLSLAHADGTPTKTDKAVLVNIFHTKQTHQYDDATPSSAVLVDGGLILHEVLPHHINSTYGKIVRDIMIKVCASKEKTIHLLLDRYMQPSIKDVERVKRGANVDMTKFIISGPDQQQRMRGTELLKHGTFKEGLSQLLVSEIQKEHCHCQQNCVCFSWRKLCETID